jgi:hypothetical protein
LNGNALIQRNCSFLIWVILSSLPGKYMGLFLDGVALVMDESEMKEQIFDLEVEIERLEREICDRIHVRFFAL